VLNKSDETSKGDNHYFVFVTLNGRDGRPEYYVVNGNHVAEKIHQTHQIWLSGRTRDGLERKDSSMRIFTPDDDSRDRWDRIALD
jgi:hypothetical protein